MGYLIGNDLFKTNFINNGDWNDFDINDFYNLTIIFVINKDNDNDVLGLYVKECATL